MDIVEALGGEFLQAFWWTVCPLKFNQFIFTMSYSPKGFCFHSSVNQTPGLSDICNLPAP